MRFFTSIRFALPGLVLGLLAACTTPDEPVEIFDPFEENNREVHRANIALDRAVLRPVSRVYGDVPQPVRRGLGNFATNLDTPRYIVNDVFQGEVEDAIHNMMRFVINTTLGIAGIFDPAGSIGLPPRASDFGETLHAWGFEEGAYIELPVFGPSTERDAAGILGDFILNPLNALDPRLDPAVTVGARTSQILETRTALGSTIDDVLYESADSYAQSRIVYLQNRRFQLGDGEPDYFDPYEDLYGE